MTASPHRARLPIRRPAITQDIIVGNITLSATLGFDEAGRPAEVFLSGAKDGSGLSAILEDDSVVISIALQHGIPASALAKSVARIPETVEGPALKAASPIGAALDLIAEYETQNG
jgi:ribonucleoside-diphosphate reductase alpha chain